jgi:hypothetical protein
MTDSAQKNMGVITGTLVDCDGFISFHSFYDFHEYESHVLFLSHMTSQAIPCCVT